MTCVVVAAAVAFTMISIAMGSWRREKSCREASSIPREDQLSIAIFTACAFVSSPAVLNESSMSCFAFTAISPAHGWHDTFMPSPLRRCRVQC